MKKAAVYCRTQPLLVFSLLLFVTVAAAMPTASVQADVGPKPSMSFTFKFAGSPIAIVSGQMLECSQPDCSDGAPLEELGPQGFTCTTDGCSSIAYGYSDYHQLVIEFSDKTRTSNVFTKKAYYASYVVTVSADNLQVEETRGKGKGCLCLPAAFSTVIIETLIASLYLVVFRLPRTLLGWVPLASLVTLPFVWLAFPQLPLPWLAATAISEVFAVGIEAVFLFLAARHVLPWRHAILLSLIMNVVSFGAGLLLVWMI